MESKRTYSEQEVTDILNHYAFIMKMGLAGSKWFTHPSENLNDLASAISSMDAIPIDFRRNETYIRTCQSIITQYDILNRAKEEEKRDITRSLTIRL